MISNAYAHIGAWGTPPSMWDADTWLFVLSACAVVALIVWAVAGSRGED